MIYIQNTYYCVFKDQHSILLLGVQNCISNMKSFICLCRGKMHKCFSPIYDASTDIVSISEEGYSCIFIGNCSECFAEKSKPVASSQTTLFFPSNSYIALRGDDIRNLLHRCIPPLQLHHHREIIEKIQINIGQFCLLRYITITYHSFYSNLYQSKVFTICPLNCAFQ